MSDDRQEIIDRLVQLQSHFGVKILYACEAGSRAWGFHSPDSDYDVRFVYSRPVEDYISLYGGRDVIDSLDLRPLDLSDEKYDIVGFDITKFLRLLSGSNPNVIEWLRSPITYGKDMEFRNKCRALLDPTFDPRASFHHYLSMMARDIKAHHTSEEVNYKKYLYMTRCMFAVKYVVDMEMPIPVPMEVLLRKVEKEGTPFFNAVMELIKQKRDNGSELGIGPKISAISSWIEENFDKYNDPKFAHSVKKYKLDERDREWYRIVLHYHLFSDRFRVQRYKPFPGWELTYPDGKVWKEPEITSGG